MAMTTYRSAVICVFAVACTTHSQLLLSRGSPHGPISVPELRAGRCAEQTSDAPIVYCSETTTLSLGGAVLIGVASVALGAILFATAVRDFGEGLGLNAGSGSP